MPMAHQTLLLPPSPVAPAVQRRAVVAADDTLVPVSLSVRPSCGDLRGCLGRDERRRPVLWASGAVDEDEDAEEDGEELAPQTPLLPASTSPAATAGIDGRGFPSSRAVSPPRDERPWLRVSRQRRPRHGELSGRGNSARAAPRDRIDQKQASFLRFISKTKGKCSRCLDPSHRAAKCEDNMRCLSCDESGHRERFLPSSSQIEAYALSGCLRRHAGSSKFLANSPRCPFVGRDCRRSSAT